MNTILLSLITQSITLWPIFSPFSSYILTSLLFLQMTVELLPTLLISVQRRCRLLNTTLTTLARHAHRASGPLSSPLTRARSAAAAPAAVQPKRGLVGFPGFPILEVLLAPSWVNLEVIVVAHLRVEGVGVILQGLWWWDEALGSVADLASRGAHGKEGCVFFAVFAQPTELCYDGEGKPCPA